MNMPRVVAQRSEASRATTQRSTRCLGVCGLGLLAMSLALSPAVDNPANTVTIQPLVHFRDANHDWLIVVDSVTREVMIYDAVTGSPVQRAGAQHGLSGVQSIAAEGARLLVASDHSRELGLLELRGFQPVAVGDR